MKKVCMITTVHPVMDTRIFLKECKSLLAAGYEVILIAQHNRDEVVDGVQIRALAKPSGRLKRMFFTTLNALSYALKEKADVYHFHDPELLPIGLILKLFGKKVIYDVHEDVPRQILSKYWIPKPLRKSIASIVEVIENITVRCLDGIVAATPHIAERFLGKCKYVINVNNYPLINELKNESVPWKEKERAVCYAGGLTVVRGIMEMVQAMEKTDAKLLLAGKFSPEGLFEKTSNLSGWENIDFKGFLDRKEIKQMMVRSMAGLLVIHPTPNYIYGLAVKMFEYMAAGIPVIVSDSIISSKDIIEKNKCGVCVNPLEPEAIAQAIQWVVEHPQEAEQMGKNGRKAVEEFYNWDIEKEKLFDLYEKLYCNKKFRH